MYKLLLILITLLSLTSCIELLDDITIHNDGTGTFKYTINLSSSKTKVSSILALDTIDGQRVPEKYEIEKKILDFKKELEKQPGIKNVSVTYNFDDYIFKLSCDFDNVNNLQSSIEKSIQFVSGFEAKSKTNWLEWNGFQLTRNIPEIVNDRFQNSSWLDRGLLKVGSYTSITRFDNPVISFSNIFSKLSKNGIAVMTKVTTEELLDNSQILKNNISIEGSK
jgi:hypothetical protein